MRKYLSYIALFILLGGCSSPPQKTALPSESNLSFIYNPSSTPLHPEILVYHESANTSRVYIKLFAEELLFNQANRQGTYQARVRFRYVLREIREGIYQQEIADSATVDYTLKRTEIRDVFLTSLPIKAQPGKVYALKVYTTDLLRQKGTVNYDIIDKISIHTSQNYKIISGDTGFPSFDRVFRSDEIFSFQYAGKNVDTVYVRYFINDFPLPRPPVTNLTSPRPDFIPDSIYAYRYSDTTEFLLPYPGMYHIQFDLKQPDGLTIFNFGDSYPRVTSTEDMVGPLAYLSSSTEFNELIQQTNKKLAVDNFWLQSAGNVSKARELIRIYYNRVFFANYYFTSYKEGWKTDRGMMFIIYGPPNKLTKVDGTETWTYFRKKGREPLRFTFSRYNTPYSDNDFTMERNFVNSMWMQAVQDWRSGKVFYSDNT
jgi:GWxTD domain-containing protein